MNQFIFRENNALARFDSPSERQMIEGFVDVCKEITSEEESYSKNGANIFAGIELEIPLVDKELQLISQEERDKIIDQYPQFASAELGAHQIEIIHQPPVDILDQGIKALNDNLGNYIRQISRSFKTQGTKIFYIGCCPLTEIENIKYTEGPKYVKYKQCPRWHREHQRERAKKTLRLVDPVNVSNPYVVALMNAVQITVDAQSLDDAVDKLNRSLMISPMATALGANSRFLDLCDTGYADVRFAAWKISHDSRSLQEVKKGLPTRIGLPARYYRDLDDYFNSILSYPFVMNDESSLKHPFEVGTGLYWRDARLKFFRDKKTVAVEFRPVALQPSLMENTALMAFYLGRLFWSQRTKEPLLPFGCIRRNVWQATRYGLQGELSFVSNGYLSTAPSKKVMEYELKHSERGLKILGVDDKEIKSFFNPLYERLVKGSPAECLAGEVKKYEAEHETKARKTRQLRREALIKSMEKLNLIASLG